jgi:hypothetical protein
VLVGKTGAETCHVGAAGRSGGGLRHLHSSRLSDVETRIGQSDERRLLQRRRRKSTAIGAGKSSDGSEKAVVVVTEASWKRDGSELEEGRKRFGRGTDASWKSVRQSGGKPVGINPGEREWKSPKCASS